MFPDSECLMSTVWNIKDVLTFQISSFCSNFWHASSFVCLLQLSFSEFIPILMLGLCNVLVHVNYALFFHVLAECKSLFMVLFELKIIALKSYQNSWVYFNVLGIFPKFWFLVWLSFEQVEDSEVDSSPVHGHSFHH